MDAVQHRTLRGCPIPQIETLVGEQAVEERQQPLPVGRIPEEKRQRIDGSPRLILALLKGNLPLGAAEKAGLKFEGDADVLYRVQPQARRASLGKPA